MTTQPDAYEQLLLELTNRARMDPHGEFARLVGVQDNIDRAVEYFNVDLAKLQSDLSQLSATQPLAWDNRLSQSATTHSQAMIAADTQSHNLPGEPSLGDRIEATGYDYSRAWENIYAYGEDPLFTHAGFFIDWGFGPGGLQDPAGHRNAIMNADAREMGIAAIAENDGGTEVGPTVVTQHLGVTFDYAPQLLGVVTNDTDNDDFYDIGEGLGGVTITATGSAGSFSTTSWDAGGYQMTLPVGTYTVTFEGNGVADTETVTIGADNVKLDAEAGASTDAGDAGGAGAAVGDDGAPVREITEAQRDHLIELYIGYFNRVPEASGLDFWVDEFEQGASFETIAQRFFDAGLQYSDVTGYASGMGLDDFVAVAYENVLDRVDETAPTAGEIDYWVEEVESGRETRGSMISEMLVDARSFYGDPEVGYVPELLDNKIELGRLHAVTLGVDYATEEQAIEKTVALADAVTPEGIEDAVAMIGQGAESGANALVA